MYPYNYAYAEAFVFAAGYLNTKDFILSTVTGTFSMANRIINALENPTVILKVFTHLLTFSRIFIILFFQSLGSDRWRNLDSLYEMDEPDLALCKGLHMDYCVWLHEVHGFHRLYPSTPLCVSFSLLSFAITWFYLILWACRIWWRLL